MNLGAEPKKIGILVGRVVVGGYVFYANVLAGPEVAKTKTTGQSVVSQAPPIVPIGAGRGPAPRKTVRANSQEFRPKLPVRPEDRPNYETVDPTLRLDLLAKVQAVEPQGGSRSIFKFSEVAAPDVKLAQAGVIIHPQPRKIGPEPPPPPAPPPPVAPPPPITLKFYGYSTPRADGTKRAFFLDGDDIFVASEGEMVKKRYRVVQIGVNSVVMEDTQFKNNRQTLVLQAELVG
jgi:hypothetical protein